MEAKEQTTLLDISDAADAERFRWALSSASGASHLFNLLAAGKGDEHSMRTMIDRIRVSAANAAARAAR